jgi:acyl-CoA synthetase (AMP-forming)/AMP-acid ligase II
LGKLKLLDIEDADLDGIFWQDGEQDLSFADVKTKALEMVVIFADLPHSSIIALHGYGPLEIWTLMLAAWSCGMSVLPFARNASESTIEIALQQLPWTVLLRRDESGTDRVISNPVKGAVSDADVFIMTSGSTGAPKAIAHTVESLAASARATLKFYSWKKGDNWLLSLDPSHIGGLQILMRTWIGRGICYYGGLPKDLLEPVSNRSFDFLSLVPTQLFRLLEDSRCEASLRHAKAILLGGAQTQDSLRLELSKLDLPISITYGSSETASQISAFKVGVLPESKEAVGEIMPIWKISGNDKELWIEGPALMQGYWQSMIWYGVKEGRFQLPDRGDIQGRTLVLEGRADQIFQVGGENLAPMEILSLLEAIYPLSDLQLHKKPDVVFGYVPRLIIRSRNKPEISRLLRAFDVLPPIKRPREIWWFVSDEVSKLSLADLEHRLSIGDDHMQRLWTYEKI